MPAAVLLPAGLTLLTAERLLLTFADHRDSSGLNAEAHQMLDYFGPTRTEREILLCAAPRRLA